MTDVDTHSWRRLPILLLLVFCGLMTAIFTFGLNWTRTADTTTPSASSTFASPAIVQFPSRATVGLPPGWSPLAEVSGEFRVSNPGQVVEDILIRDGVIIVEAPNVTLRRVQAINTNLVNDSRGACQNGLVIVDSEFVTAGSTTDDDLPVIASGGYTLRNSAVDGAAEGLRVGGASRGCGDVTIEHSFIRIVAPAQCNDWHGDGIQGYDGSSLRIRTVVVILAGRTDCGGTAPFFYPDEQNNTFADIDGLVVSGGGYSFRIGTPGSVRNLYVVDSSWYYAPVKVECHLLNAWHARTAQLDASGFVKPLDTIACDEGG